MVPYQVALETFLRTFPNVRALMETEWGWPVAESIHFVGLTLLFGSIAAWDLRLLGVARSVPIAAFHRLVPFAVIGFAVNASSGMFFLMTAPDQYVYNPAFHVKMACVILAGLNVMIFYLAIFRRVTDAQAPTRRVPGAVSGAVSLVLWMVVIICGRLITFYRPIRCGATETLGFLADCIVR
jgi:uncharacterized membrane protein